MKLLFSLIVLLSSFSFAAESQIDSGDTAWVLISTALVLLMTPAGLALFYGGLTTKKNVLNTVAMSYMAFCVVIIFWVVAGYSLTFSGEGAYLGDLEAIFLSNIKINDVVGTIPAYLYVAFQGTFAAIAVAIVSGSIIERVKFSSWLVFSILWLMFCYVPLTHWVWGGGFLSNSGELDFAGGTVIHVNAGIAGLIFSMLLGKRKDHHIDARPTSVKLAVVGSAILWFGWIGFNAGSALGANALAGIALTVTIVSGAAGGISWLLIEWVDDKKPGMLGMSSGVVSGLVGITPAAGYVDVSAALLIGLSSGALGYFGAIHLKRVLKYDDTLDAFGIHGVVGIWGCIATGIFANPEINDAVGALYGNMNQVWVQLKAVFITVLYSSIVTIILFFITKIMTNGVRITKEMEEQGMDIYFHDESGFYLNDEK